jgi:hypothetical protein
MSNYSYSCGTSSIYIDNQSSIYNAIRNSYEHSIEQVKGGHALHTGWGRVRERGVVDGKEARSGRREEGVARSAASRQSKARSGAMGVTGARGGFVNCSPRGKLKCASAKFGLSQYNNSGLRAVRCHYLSIYSVVN